MTSPIAAVRALPRFAYLSPAEAREVVLAVLGAVDVEVMARIMWRHEIDATPDYLDPPDTWDDDRPDIEAWRDDARKSARAAIDALVAEVQEEGR